MSTTPPSRSYAPIPEVTARDPVRQPGRLRVAGDRAPSVASADSSVPVWVSRWATRLSLFVFDAVGLLTVAGLVSAVGRAFGEGWIALGPLDVLVGTGTLAVLFACAGLYSQIVVHPAVEMRRLGTMTGALGMAAAAAAFTGTGDLQLALTIAGGGVIGMGILPASRALGRILLAAAPWWGLPAVVVGDARRAAAILDTLRRWPEIGLRPIAALDPADRAPAGGDGHSNAPAAGTCSTEALNLSRERAVPYVLLADAGMSHAARTHWLSHYSKFFEHVVVVGDAAGAAAIWQTEPSAGGLFGYGIRHFRLQPVGRLVKRMVDLIGASLILLVVAPLFAAIAALIRIDSPGAALYRQNRMGRDGRIFTVLKFRTMFVDADAKLQEILQSDPARRAEYERYHKLQDDPRVTPIGRILRRLSLDELPQILNVLRGDMSLVGPRAYMPGELGKMKGLARTVLQTPPGITGLWQVSGRNDVSFATRVDLDVHYVQNWTPWLDLYLLVRTLPVVLSGRGAS